eukprot:TRINITY_DN5573_c0_g1_i2.p1 TRINITY_DN5573_c0_g1~~TRINITY_DN5573_c0_g1_i2.p1  ORF type:complete len:384 (+),score=64.44 TRINITY_DN5573_c0_g1_i2:169-1320(+)
MIAPLSRVRKPAASGTRRATNLVRTQRTKTQLIERAQRLGQSQPIDDNTAPPFFCFHTKLGYRGIVAWTGMIKQRIYYPSIVTTNELMATTEPYRPHFKFDMVGTSALNKMTQAMMQHISDKSHYDDIHPVAFDQVSCRTRVESHRWYFILAHRDDVLKNVINYYACQTWTPSGICATADFARHDEIERYEPVSCESVSNSLLRVMYNTSPVRRGADESQRLIARPTALRFGNELTGLFKERMIHTVVKEGMTITCLPLQQSTLMNTLEQNDPNTSKWSFKVGVTYTGDADYLDWEFACFSLIHEDNMQETTPLKFDLPAVRITPSCRKLQFYQEMDLPHTVRYVTGLMIFTAGKEASFYELPCIDMKEMDDSFGQPFTDDEE